MSADTNTEEHSWTELSEQALESASQIELPGEIQVPALPTALTRFINASRDPDADIRELGKIVEHDPGLTLDLLKFVNAAATQTDRPALTPTDALVRLGISKAKNFLVSAGIKKTTLGFRTRLMNHQNFWNESLQRAMFAKAVASCVGTDAELAFMGGLLQDFVLPVLTNLYDTDYLEYLGNPNGMALAEWEQQKFGFDHAAAGAKIAREWNLPDKLICCIYYHHQMEFALLAPNAEIFELFPTTLAALLPDQLKQVPRGLDRLLDADQMSSRFALPDLCENVDAQLNAFCDGDARPQCLVPTVEAAMQRRMAEQTAAAAT